jgi:UDP-3-O-[3-hydroxymyristoyl] N-acetylglucosamine deacetylase
MYMDGLPQPLIFGPSAWRQCSLKAPIDCVGIGLHSGRRVHVTLRPAEPNHGIVFRRTDLGRDIPARFDRVVDTRLSTVLGHESWGSVRVGTVEHLMAAFAGLGVDNALVEVDGPELPILDGSAAPFAFLIECAGIAEQDAPRHVIEIRHTVRVNDGDSFAELRPAPPGAQGLEIAVSIDFPAEAIGQQALRIRLEPHCFRYDLARARTFVLAEQIEHLRATGLAQGGSLENAVVVDQHRVLNPGGLRMEDEFARHKMVDVIGDIALAGAAIRGRLVTHRPGHSLNNRLLRALFADASAWQDAASAALTAAAAA